MANRHPSKDNINMINLGFTLVDIGFLGVTISHVALSCRQYLYNINNLVLSEPRLSNLSTANTN